MSRAHRVGRAARLRIAAAALGLLLISLTLAHTSTTLAAWQNPEYGRATFTAGVLQPPTALKCTGGLASVTFTWTNGTGSPARTGLTYTWANGSPTTLGVNATTVTLFSLLNIGSVFKLRSVSGNWTSTAVTATVTSIVVGGVTCAIGTAA